MRKKVCAPWGRYYFFKICLFALGGSTVPMEFFLFSIFLCYVGAVIIFVTAATNSQQTKKTFFLATRPRMVETAGTRFRGGGFWRSAGTLAQLIAASFVVVVTNIIDLRFFN